MEHDLAKARNMKLVLCLSEQLSGLKINFNKSELFCIGRAKEEQEAYKELFVCELGSLPFTYLGIPTTIASFPTMSGSALKIDLKRN